MPWSGSHSLILLFSQAVQTKLNDLSSKFPMINNLVNKINLRKRRDTIIIGLVIGICMVFMIWYIFG